MHHRLRAHDIAAECFAHGLMAETHAHDGSLPAKCCMAATEMPASFGEQGPGPMTRYFGFRVSISSMVISSLQRTKNFLPQFGKVLNDVVGEAVVIVDK